MRRIAQLTLLAVIALFIAGCGGPEDSNEQIVAACERQREEIANAPEESATPTAPSTEERLAATELRECAGQPANVVAAADEEQPAEGDGEAPAEEPTDEGDAEAEAEPTPVELDPAARDLFTTSCGGCHALSDAGTEGAVGPNLDETKLTAAEISALIAAGKGAMPAGLLQGDDAEAVAAYVEGAAAAAAAG
jgi:cytochrome c551